MHLPMHRKYSSLTIRMPDSIIHHNVMYKGFNYVTQHLNTCVKKEKKEKLAINKMNEYFSYHKMFPLSITRTKHTHTHT